MTRTMRLPLDVAKEIRSLAAVWIACLVAVMVAALPGIGELRRFGIPAYFFGAAALGALSIGQEYSDRTLTLLLSQPARRERLFLVKLGVLAAMLMALYAVTGGVVVLRLPESGRLPYAALLPVLCGLFLAPWLTMLCRNAIAGALFTIALPATLLVLSELLYVAVYGSGPAAGFETAVIWRGTLGLCAVGAVMGWRTFMRLEAIDDRGPEIHLPRWLRTETATTSRAPAITKRHPIWLLVGKEIRLQPMALAIAGLYMLGWLTLVSVRPFVGNDVDDIFTALTFFYGVSISMLIGSLASAEERQLGTLEWQVLLSLSTRTQWTVKVGTALGLALLLALGLPGLLASIYPGVAVEPGFLPVLAMGVATLTVVSLYVSTLCPSGLWAFLMSVPAISALAVFVSMVVQLEFSAWGIAARLSSEKAWQRFGISRVDRSRLSSLLALLIVAAILAVISRSALANHRSAERSFARVWKQVVMVTVLLMAGAIVLVGLAAFS